MTKWTLRIRKSSVNIIIWTEYMQKGDLEMYSDEQYRKVLEMYRYSRVLTLKCPQ